MTAIATPTRRPGRPRATGPFPCGCPRNPENTTVSQQCRIHFRIAMQARQARLRAEGPRVPRFRTPVERTPRPPITLRPATLALVESCRPEYEHAVGQFELFTALPRRTA